MAAMLLECLNHKYILTHGSKSYPESFPNPSPLGEGFDVRKSLYLLYKNNIYINPSPILSICLAKYYFACIWEKVKDSKNTIKKMKLIKYHNGGLCKHKVAARLRQDCGKVPFISAYLRLLVLICV